MLYDEILKITPGGREMLRREYRITYVVDYPYKTTPLYQCDDVQIRNIWRYSKRNAFTELNQFNKKKQPLYVLVIYEKLYGGF